ncbi:G-patch domain-containing protein [Apiospora rasikravindrae]|uniref:G-patch domain-containing protein n=1 Tax=Apiospora rasikravindrae TaxID=990691 RepID=A0ABR1TX38_9PEZI
MAPPQVASHMGSDGDGDDDIPLEHKKPFSAGLRRKLIQFVPASSEETTSTEQNRATSTPAKSIEDIYLNIVMPPRDTASAPPESSASQILCELCQLPIDDGATASHETSISHQVCLEHSHPPSALDRSRMGLAVLQSQGEAKEDTLGIGVQVPKDLEKWKKEKPQKLDAAKVRKKAAEDKKRREKLQRQFYGNPDIEKYLG